MPVIRLYQGEVVMRVLLIQPPQGTNLGLSRALITEPLGLENVAASLLEDSHEVRILDLRIKKLKKLYDEIRYFSPKAVGISCSFTTDVYPTLKIAKYVKELNPNTFVFVGGHHASLLPSDLLRGQVDAVVVGEGEITTKEMINSLEHKGDVAQVKGVMTPYGFTPREIIRNLDALPFPARHLTKDLRRQYHIGFDGPMASLEMSRGCPYECNFCSVWVFYSRKIRGKSPERLAEEIAGIKEKYIFLTDDIAFLHKEPAVNLALKLKEMGIKKKFTCETRADVVVRHKDVIALWKEVGLEFIFLGLEKIDDEGLKSVNKHTKATVNEKALEILRSLGITPMATFIVDPEWTEEDFEKLKRYVIEHRLETPSFTILTPLPGTEVYEERKNELITHNYLLFDLLHAVLPTKLSLKEFYTKFAELCHQGHRNKRIGWSFMKKLLVGILRGNPWAAIRILNVARLMRNPETYLKAHKYSEEIPLDLDFEF
jgi:hopanoid C-3 methylase HpnR